MGLHVPLSDIYILLGPIMNVSNILNQSFLSFEGKIKFRTDRVCNRKIAFGSVKFSE